MVSNNSSTGGSEFFAGGGGLSNGLSNTGSTTLNYSIVRANSAAFVGGGIFAGGGPMKINHSIVTGNSADSTAVAECSCGTGQRRSRTAPFPTTPTAVAQGFVPDNLPGVCVAPSDYLGLGNSPTFTTTHSTYS